MRARGFRRVIHASGLLAAAALGASEARAQSPRVTVGLGGAPMEFVRVPAGTFSQGSPDGEPGRRDDEVTRDVIVSRDFYLAVTPVTRGQFSAFVAATGYRTEAEVGRSGGFGLAGATLQQRPGATWRAPGFSQDDAHPVTLVTFEDARRYLAWASTQAGHTLRLPTEAEWERACRGGGATAFPSTSSLEGARAEGWFHRDAPLGTHPVAALAANGFGLFDMVGHVAQWVDDWYAPYATGPVNDPRGAPPAGAREPARRVLRGGSWLRPAERGRCAARERMTPGSRSAEVGFRVAMDDDLPVTPPPPPPVSEVPRLPLETPPPPASNDGDGLSGARLAMFGGLLAALSAVALLLRRGRAVVTRDAATAVSPSGPKPPTGLRVDLAADGVKVSTSPAPFPRVAHATAFRQGAPHPLKFTLDAHATSCFVYTGWTPERAHVDAVHRVNAPAAAVHMHVHAPAHHEPVHMHTHVHHEPVHMHAHVHHEPMHAHAHDIFVERFAEAAAPPPQDAGTWGSTGSDAAASYDPGPPPAY